MRSMVVVDETIVFNKGLGREDSLSALQSVINMVFTCVKEGGKPWSLETIWSNARIYSAQRSICRWIGLCISLWVTLEATVS